MRGEFPMNYEHMCNKTGASLAPVSHKSASNYFENVEYDLESLSKYESDNRNSYFRWRLRELTNYPGSI